MMPRRSSEGTRPLIEQCEGADADDRASLRAAWKRIQYSRQGMHQVTDLHVRELIFYVFATDRSRLGVQLSYEAIMRELDCKLCTARNVVQRAANEFGLLVVKEQRFVTGGQSANRYSINWPVVRSINAGLIERYEPVASSRPPVVSQQGPVVTQQGPAVTRQPYKESPRTLPRLEPSSSNLLQSDPARWEEAEAVLLRLDPERRPTAWRDALRDAKAAGVSPDYVIAIVDHYNAHGAAYLAGALYRRLQRSHPDLPPSEGWPKPSPSATGPAKPSPQALAIRDAQRALSIERGTIRAARAEGLSDVAIRDRIADQLRIAGLDPQLSEWCRAVPEISQHVQEAR